MENKKRKIGLVIMASGLGKRFGGNKLLTNFGGKPLIQWILDTSQGLFDKRIVVTRSKDVEMLCEKNGIECIYHELPGRNDTVRLGLTALKDLVDTCFFMPADQPLIRRETLLALIAEVHNRPDKIIRPKYEAQVGSPIGFPKKYYAELLALPEKKGGNFVAKKYPLEVFFVPVSCEWELFDIDTKEDLERAKNILTNSDK